VKYYGSAGTRYVRNCLNRNWHVTLYGLEDNTTSSRGRRFSSSERPLGCREQAAFHHMGGSYFIYIYILTHARTRAHTHTKSCQRNNPCIHQKWGGGGAPNKKRSTSGLHLSSFVRDSPPPASDTDGLVVQVVMKPLTSVHTTLDWEWETKYTYRIFVKTPAA
jgi:hypothetical protein